eukprot:m51a1_g5903 putative C-tail anchored protein (109) ;mRNA; f:566643-567322
MRWHSPVLVAEASGGTPRDYCSSGSTCDECAALGGCSWCLSASSVLACESNTTAACEAQQCSTSSASREPYQKPPLNARTTALAVLVPPVVFASITAVAFLLVPLLER